MLSDLETIEIPENTNLPYKSDAKSTTSNKNLKNSSKEAFIEQEKENKVIVNNEMKNPNNDDTNTILLSQMKEKLKEEHRAGLSKLKYALQTSRALQIGELQNKVQKLKEKSNLVRE